MDIATVIGLIVSSTMILVALAIGAGVGVYVDVPSMLIVLGGTTGIMLVNYPLNKILNLTKILVKGFMFKVDEPTRLIEQMTEFAVKARRDGILSLESAEEELRDTFLKKGIRLAVDGTEPEVIKTILETELEYMEERHNEGAGILSSLADFAPAMGMIGTLIGLVAMLQSLSDPSSIGPAMAVALLTTFYGALLANLFAAPMSGKLKTRSGEERLLREIMIAGIMAIQAGDNPRIVEQKLNAFLQPGHRRSQFD